MLISFIGSNIKRQIVESYIRSIYPQCFLGEMF